MTVKRMLDRAGVRRTVVDNGSAAVRAALAAAPPLDCILMVSRCSVQINHRLTPGCPRLVSALAAKLRQIA